MGAAADAASKSSAIKTGKEVILFACFFDRAKADQVLIKPQFRSVRKVFSEHMQEIPKRYRSLSM